MTTEHSTYTYEGGARETVALKRGPATPTGYALLTIERSDGQAADCFVNTAWLRDRLDDLDPRPLTPDAMTAREHLDAAWEAAHVPADGIIPAGAEYLWRSAATGRVVQGVPDEEDASAGAGGLIERRLLDPARPEGAEDIEALIREAVTANGTLDDEALANYLAAHLTDPTRKEA